MSSRFKLLAAVCALAIVLVSCGSPAPTASPTTSSQTQATKAPEATSKPEATKAPAATATAAAPALSKIARINLNRSYVNSLDPQNGTQSATMAILNLVYENLIRIDEKGNVLPAAAEKWQAATDGKSMTFTLRAGLKRSDGAALTAKDFAWIYRRAADPRNALRTSSRFADIQGVPEALALDPKGKAEDIEKALDAIGVKATDDRTLVFTFNKVAASYFAFSGYLWTSWGGPTDPTIISKNGATWWTQAQNHVSNGPFMISKIEEQKKITLVPNPNYWGDKPKLNRIEFTFVTDAALAFEAYKKGELDVITVGSDYMDAVQTDATLAKELFRGEVNQWNMLGFGVQRPPFDNPLVRKAFSLAFDSDTYNKDVLKGSVKTTHSLLYPGVEGFDSAISQVSYDPRAAVATLIEAGYGAADSTAANPKIDCKKLGEIKLSYAGTPQNHTLFQFIAGNYAKVFGCAVTLDPVEATTLSAMGQNPKTMAMIGVSFSAASTLFVDEYFNTWTCGGNAARSAGYCNKDLDQLLNQAKLEYGTPKATESYKAANKMLLGDYAFYIFGRSEAWYLVKPYLKGFTEKFGWADSVYPGQSTQSQAYDVDTTKVGKGYPTQ